MAGRISGNPNYLPGTGFLLPNRTRIEGNEPTSHINIFNYNKTTFPASWPVPIIYA